MEGARKIAGRLIAAAPSMERLLSELNVADPPSCKGAVVRARPFTEYLWGQTLLHSNLNASDSEFPRVS